MATFKLYYRGRKMHARLMYPRRSKPVGAVLHTTVGYDSEEYLQGGVLKEGRIASADYLIKRDGTIIQLAPSDMGTYHLGQCWWNGKLDTSDQGSHDTVGIELENMDTDNQVPTEAQHRACALLLLELAHHYRWSPLHVWAHSGLARPIGRRTDPGGLDWGFLFWLMGPGALKDQLLIIGEKS